MIALFLQSGPVQTALALSAATSMLCGALGLFTLLRGQAFAGHALADVSSAGGAGSLLFGLSPLLGFLLFGLAAVGVLEVLQPRHSAARDEAAGILLGAGLGITALLLHFCLTHHGTTGAAQTVMFGAMFAVPSGMVFWAWGLSALCLLILALIARPLLLTTLSPELARTSGLPIRLLSLAFLFLLACGVTLAAMTIGAILATALLVGPAAVALRLARDTFSAILLAIVCGVAACWGGISLAYASYSWIPGHTWPVSFFIVALLLLFYLLATRLGPQR